MSKNKISTDKSTGENTEAAKTALKQEKNNPAVKEALKKEKQPERPEDLAPIHNTHETGTSGGDQRASETEIRKK